MRNRGGKSPEERAWSVIQGLAVVALAGALIAFVLNTSPGLMGKVIHRSLPRGEPATRASAAASYARLPLAFVPNVGQTEKRVRFLSRAAGYTLYLTPTEAVFAFPTRKIASPANVRRQGTASGPASGDGFGAGSGARWVTMELVGGNAKARLSGESELAGKTNYLLGNDPARWHRGIPNFARVQYEQVYPGVDLAFYGNQRELEYDFVVAPGANPGMVKLAFHGETGMHLERDGALEIAAGPGELVLAKPRVYQPTGQQTIPVEGCFAVLDGNQVGFRIGTYNPALPLVIDPTVSPILSYSSFLGGSQDDEGADLVVDSSGDAYILGSTSSTDFPTAGPEQPANKGGFDAFIAKMNSTGTALVYSTYIGGGKDDHGEAIAVDPAGDAYVTGNTASADFPTTTAPAPIQTCLPGGKGDIDAFVAKLNPAGNKLLISTCLGGSMADHGLGIALDTSNNIYVSGDTASADFPVTTGAFQTTFGGGTSNAFLTEIKADGSAALYSTYLGGSGDDHARAIAIDASGNVYLTGNTTSANFPVSATAYQMAFGGSGAFSLGDAFLSELKPTGKGAADLLYSTYLGGANDDAASAIALGSNGNAYITGLTTSSRFPLVNAYQTGLKGGDDAFVAELNPTAKGASSLVYSTFLGGSGNDQGSSIALDSAGNIYLTGATASPDFPEAGAFQPALGTFFGFTNAFYVKLSPTGQTLIHSSFLGGNGSDSGNAIALDSQGNAYITGSTSSANFPTTTGAFETTYGGAGTAGLGDAFVTKILPSSTVVLNPTSLSFGNLDAGTTSASKTITVTNGGDASLSISTILASGPFSESNTCTTALNPGGTCAINVLFSPGGAGAANGQVSITDNAGDSPQVAGLSGTGVAFAMSAATTTASVSPGQSASYTVNITPNDFVGSVTLSCDGAPAGANCTVNPASVNLDGSTAVNASVQVTTTKHSGMPGVARPVLPAPPLAAIFMLALALILIGCIANWVRSQNRHAFPAVIALVMLLALAGAGCALSNSTSGTPAGTYTLAVKGSSGGLTQGVNLTLTVQ